ncbi:ribosomal l25 family protein [Cyclospora cayetanensis]|uniref:Ribosomal l25 family protein n=1 Tax=Cyclospora cayetanensis TaxID=88456 RepID=A0A1D3D6Z3_9EIME|nr:ribosomal l25 family protein [Cyclospora cayetanensis]
MRQLQWPLMRADITVDVDCMPWERFVSSEQLQASGFVPAVIKGQGPYRRCAIPRVALEALAFDEAEGHLSLLFSARLFRLRMGDLIECCVAKDVKADPLARHLYFVGFERHVEGKLTEVSLPLTLVGLLACPAYHKGYHVELAKPTVPVQFVGLEPPPPFLVDVSELEFTPPYSAITVDCLASQLPTDGTARFPPSLSPKEEVAWAYEVGSLPEASLPPDWKDPNFIDRRGNMMDVWYHRKFPRPS